MQEENPQQNQKWESFKDRMTAYMNSRAIQNKVSEMLSNTRVRLTLNLDDIRHQESINGKELADSIHRYPLKAMPILQTILQSLVQEYQDQGVQKKKNTITNMTKDPTYRISFEGSFGAYHITPRGLTSKTVGSYVRVQGIITRLSIVKPKLLKSTHYCENTKAGFIKEYSDSYDLTDQNNVHFSNAYPLYDADKNPLSTEYGYCKYRDYQTALLQEMPERTPTGVLPRSIEVIIEDDLVDHIKPGDRVEVTGAYLCVSGPTTSLNGTFKTVLVATAVCSIAAQAELPKFSPEDIKNIKMFAERNDILDVLSQSISPSIFGHNYIKKAILLMLLGGMEKNLESGTRLRGDINILMIGDPSTAKSQLLRHVLSIAPLSVSTTGRGSSGVGLTAAVTIDQDTGEKVLEAGAMVLADRGVACIDEFDKMSEEDRVAIHEVMEQQTVTIAKAGIHCSLNARCAVIAAANPIYGEYQRDLPPTSNVGLPDSLLSRFDLIFIVLDENDSNIDRMISDRVIRNHRYQSHAMENIGYQHAQHDVVIEPEYLDLVDTSVFEKHNEVLYESRNEIVTQNFLKKYLAYAKRISAPVLTEEANTMIVQMWAQLREKDRDGGNLGKVKIMPITIRTLETLIRLATAHAKLRMANKITIADCEEALILLNFALFGEEEPKKKVIGKTSATKKIMSQELSRKEQQPSQKSSKMEEEHRRGGLRSTDKSMMKEDDRATPQKAVSSQIKKKIKETSEEEVARKLLENVRIGSIEVSREQCQFVYRAMTKLSAQAKGKNKMYITFNELWNDVQSSGLIEDQDTLRRVLLTFERQISHDEQDRIFLV